jgi:hypothetical protein
VAEVARRVDPVISDQDVIAEPAVDDVIAASPIQRIVEFIPGDDLRAVRAGDILDALQHVGFTDDSNVARGEEEAGVAAVGVAEPEADGIPSYDRSPGVVTDIAGGISTKAADQHVVAEPAIERVSAVAPIENIGNIVADDLVRPAGADHVLNAEQRVGGHLHQGEVGRLEFGGSAAVVAGAEVHHHAIGGVGRPPNDEVEEMVAGIIDSVSPVPTVEGVVAQSPGEQVVERVAGQAVVEPGADETFDQKKGVAGRIAAACKGGLRVAVAPRESHGDRCRRRLVARKIEAGTAVERVGAAAAFQEVVAVAAVQHVLSGLVDGEKEISLPVDDAVGIGRVVAGVRSPNDIVMAGAGDLENVTERIALGEAAVLRRFGQVDGDRRSRTRVVDRVVVEHFENEKYGLSDGS